MPQNDNRGLKTTKKKIVSSFLSQHMMYWGGFFFLQNQQRQDILNKRQEVYGTARYVAERMLLLTNGLHSLFRRYIRTTKTGKVDILDFRALDPCVFQCCVAIKRPIRPQTFMVKMTFSC